MCCTGDSTCGPGRPLDSAAVAGAAVLYSVSFVWPRGKDWETGNTWHRWPPRWYFECLVDFIHSNSGTHGVDFVVHMHGVAKGLVPTRLLHRVCKRPSTLEISYCSASLPALWPNACRFVPLIDSLKDCTVIVADIHDTPSLQRSTIRSLTHSLQSKGKGLALTFWPIEGESYIASEIADNGIAPPPSLEPELPATGAVRHRWTIDGGLAISTLAAREAILASHGDVTFHQHLQVCANTYEWDCAEANGTDEALLQLYLLAFRSRDVPPQGQHTFANMAEAIRKVALPFVHNLTRRSDDPPRLDLPAPATPKYLPASTQASKQFVYDQEGDFVHAGVAVPLQWSAHTHVPAHISSPSTENKRVNRTGDNPIKRGRPRKHPIKTDQSPASQERAAIYFQQHGRESAYDKCSCVDKHRTVLLCDGCDEEFSLCCVGLAEVPNDDEWFCKECEPVCAALFLFSASGLRRAQPLLRWGLACILSFAVG